MPDVKTTAIEPGDRVVYVKAHHAHHPKLKRLVGRDGTVEFINDNGPGAPEMLVVFGPFNRWWIRGLWLELAGGVE